MHVHHLLLRLHLLGVRIDANVLQGIWQMTAQGDPITAAMVLFCAVVAPVLTWAVDRHGWRATQRHLFAGTRS